ncbi:MAG: hypothetical protein RXS23_00190 [Metallosphaera yellowstonensis]|uniref:Uncharacterized protein n=1 Tax=Metallosphaera yellowstonensis MK1 TaxID=671065 RepID=H2C8B9_9CREN|nr:hypothetical protein [Metallosphaera yellowstonensis]EHP68395.1 hypothetical protein MetMK1DRAFT_00028270 [Metallosphaera yellowstonensis MK1]
MFRVILGIYSDPLQMKELFKDMENVLQNICKPARIGASYICSPSPTSLVTAVFKEREAKPMLLLFMIESENAQEVVRFATEISQRLKSMGIHSSLLSTDETA